jgi:hypothetical protein
MISEFSRLNDHEAELMMKAPFLVCILIAGADNDIDRKEIREALQVITKGAKGIQSLLNYFNELSEDFEDKLKMLIQGYPYDTASRSKILEDELMGLNDVLPKINAKFASQYYEALLRLAEKVAESSGGVLGINSVGREELKYLRLEMINNPVRS